MRGMIGGLVLAAGAGSRLGGRKQLADLGGRPLLAHALDALAGAGLDEVCVVLGSDAQAVLRGVDLGEVRPVVCPRWAEGQAASLRAGAAALRYCEALVVTLGDQPFVSPRAVERVVGERSPGVDAVRATYGGEPGHPVLLERTVVDGLATLRGDVGARGLLSRARTREVACDGLGSPVDVDSEEQLENARRAVERGRAHAEEVRSEA